MIFIPFNTKHNIVRLKKLFNDMYVKMTKVKENELAVMAQRNERLHRIQQDINLMQRLNGDEITDFDRYESSIDSVMKIQTHWLSFQV